MARRTASARAKKRSAGGNGRVRAASRSARENLARELARRCRGRTGIVGPLDRALAGALAARGVEHLAADPGGAPFDTILVTETLEFLRKDEARRALRDAWHQLAEDGRLLVCVPNEDLGEDPRCLQRFDRRGLRRLLRSFGRPKLVTGQPFRWLVMAVDARTRHSAGVRERYRVIAQLCRGDVLELGCGSGELTGTIAESGHQCEGVDINPEKIDEARRYHPELRFLNADILDLESKGRLYGTVVLAEVLEHVDEDTGARMLQKAWELLAPGGRLVVSVPNEDCVPHPNHVQQFTRASLAERLAPFGRLQLVADQPFRYLLMTVRKGSCAP